MSVPSNLAFLSFIRIGIQIEEGSDVNELWDNLVENNAWHGIFVDSRFPNPEPGNNLMVSGNPIGPSGTGHCEGVRGTSGYLT